MNEFLDLLPAQQRLDEATWYRGTADAVFQNFDIFRAARPDHFVVLAGDHVYKMDYSNMLAEPYWRDVGTIDAYWAANLDLVMPVPSLDIYDPNWPIWTYQQQLPPAKFVFDDDDRRGMAVDSMISGGCIISGAHISRSLLFSNCRVNSHARTRDAVVLPEVDVGRHARLNRVVVDRGCRIPEGTVIGEDPRLDGERFYLSEGGVTLVTADMLDALT
jgi:glucose-1-phosphate adenylyltransferase